jgi:PEP-CTERM motif
VSFAGQDATTSIQNQVSIGCVGTPGAGGSGFNGSEGTGGTVTPEPATLLLLGTGFAGLLAGKARMRRARSRRA